MHSQWVQGVTGRNMLKRGLFSKTGVYLFGFLLLGFFAPPWEVFAKDVKNLTNFVHRVSPGDTLSRIARQYLPLTEALTMGHLIERIKALNGIQGSLIRTNQRLQIPLVRSTPVIAKTFPKPVHLEAGGYYVKRFSSG